MRPKQNHDEWRRIGQEMEDLRRDARMPRSTLARHLRISSTFLWDMEWGHRFYADKYVIKASRFILKSL